MQIRRAVAEDARQVAQLWHLQWHRAHAAIMTPEMVRLRSPQSFMARTQARVERTWVAEAGGAIAGFFMIEDRELYQFYVGPDQQGSGLATRLMAAAEVALPPGRAWLACSVGNDRAAAFYTKAGWQNCGAEPCTVETAEGPRQVTVWRFERDIPARP